MPLCPRRPMLLLGLATSLTLALASPNTGIAENARSADAFVDFIGVNTHLGYSDTTYRDFEGIIKPRLLELGVRHIRDGTFSESVLQKYLELGRHGIRVLFITDSRRAVERAQRLRPALLAIEGMNEPDTKPGWVPRLREEQQRLYAAVKGNPATADLPVVVSSLANIRNSPGELGDLSAVLDFGNMHPYAAGQPPSRHWGWGLSMERALTEARKVSAGKPLFVTECGYHNKVNNPNHPGVSEAAEARYLPRLLLVYFDQPGLVRAYKYEFLDLKPDPGMTDMECHFGLVRTNGTPKPSFVALKNMIHLLSDPGPSFKPGTLDYKLSGKTNSIRHTLLQKRDGTFWLALFHEVVSFDLKTKEDVAPAPAPLTLRFGHSAHRVRLFRPTQGTEPIRTVTSQELDLNVPDEVLLVEIER